MKKILSFLLLFCILVSITVPAFATEVTESTEGGETATEVTEPSESPEPTEGNTEPSEPSESTPEVTEPSETTEPTEGNTEPSEPSEPLKVDLTEQSIEAIADAVENSSGSIVNKDGVVYTIPSEVFEHVYDYKYLTYLKGGSSNNYWFLYNDPSEIYLSVNAVGDVSINCLGLYVRYQYGSYKSTGSGINVNSFTIFYSDCDIYNKDGSLFYSSDGNVDFNISFDTGFEDLSLDPVSSKNFVAPVISYDGYEFDGWYFDREFTKPFQNTGFEFTADTILYAKWIPYRTINFITNIEGFELDSVKVLSGEAYTVSSFSYAGYEFVGAYTDEAFEHQFVGGTIVDSDLTLYLRFEEIVYDFGALLAEQNALIIEQIERMEGLVYVQMAQGIMLSVIIVALFIFRKRDGLGC